MHYAVSVWNPHHQSLIEKLEKVQKRATKLVINIKKITLRRKVTTIEVTHFEIQNLRIRGDMIELYKIFAGKYDNNTTEWITGKCIEILHYNSHTFIMICVKLILPIGLSQYGIIYQIMLLLLLP